MNGIDILGRSATLSGAKTIEFLMLLCNGSKNNSGVSLIKGPECQDANCWESVLGSASPRCSRAFSSPIYKLSCIFLASVSLSLSLACSPLRAVSSASLYPSASQSQDVHTLFEADACIIQAEYIHSLFMS